MLSGATGVTMTYSISVQHLRAMLGRWHLRGPAYLELAHALQVLIMDGRLPAGTRIPAERIMAPQLGVSRNTVTAAYQLLRERGYVLSHRGTGSFVAIPEE